MMLALVGIALMFWFGSLLLAYSLGMRNETRRAVAKVHVALQRNEWPVVGEEACLECGNTWVHALGCASHTLAPPPPPAPPDDTDPGRRIKEGGWPPR